MICIDCKKRQGKTSRTKRCGNCYMKYWIKKNPEKWKIISKRTQIKTQFSGNRIKVLERDNYTCQICGDKPIGKKLHIHHIDDKGSQLPKNKQNNSLDNLVTLCAKCHGIVEKDKRSAKLLDRTIVWSRKYKSCIDCKTTKFKYCMNGRCSSCAEKFRYNYKHQFYLKNKDKPYYNNQYRNFKRKELKNYLLEEKFN